MKKQTRLIPWMYLILAALGAVLRGALYTVAVDDRGLLAWHPLELGLWLVTALAVGGTLALIGRVSVPQPGKSCAGVGAVCMALGIGLTLILGPESGIPVLNGIHTLLGWAAVAGLLYGLTGRRFFGYSLLCLFLCVQMVIAYQGWSEMTQWMDYGFGVCALLCTVLFAYFRGAETAGLKTGKFLPLLALPGMFFCGTALPESPWSFLLLGSLFWQLAETTAIRD